MSDEKEKPSFDFEAHRRTAVEEYRRRRTLFETFAKEVSGILGQALVDRGIRVSANQFRAKNLESFGKKAATPSEQNPGEPKYSSPMVQITDLAGIRVITFFPRTVDEVCKTIYEEFEVIERVDHTASALAEDRLGYQSVHLIAKLRPNRTRLSEYRRFDGLLAEIQVRTIMQHAWAEIEHDIRYKSTASIPKAISRRFMTLAGMLEVADREFQAIQEEDDSIRANARTLIGENRLSEVELTADALHLYLDQHLGSDDRISDWSYEWMTKMLRRIGFQNLAQIEACVGDRDDDQLSRLAWGSRMGQLSRFEILLLAGMGGDNFLKHHPYSEFEWFSDAIARRISNLASGGITLGNYLPPRD